MLLQGYTDRSATAEVCFVLCDETGHYVFTGSTAGTISDEPRGKKGFGWDPIFIPDGCTQTWGEMNATAQRETSMRREALLKLQTHLQKNYQNYGL